MTHPTGAITRDEAARILAVHVGTADRLIRRGVLTPARRFATAQLDRKAVERLALTTRPVSRLLETANSYCAGRAEAARLLGVSKIRVGQLADAGKLPYVVHEPSGRRLYRREQVEVIGNARRQRFGKRLDHARRDDAVATAQQ